MAFPFDPIKRPESVLNQKSLVAMIKNKLANLTDVRTGKNSQYEVSDAALSAFAVFFLQNPSFWASANQLTKNARQKQLAHVVWSL